MKKILILESVKGAGKTTLLEALKEDFPDAVIYNEDSTLETIKHSQDKAEIIAYYKTVIERIENSENEIFFLDRFHFTKWPIENYEKDYFKEIEELLLQKFDISFIFLKIDPEKIYDRLLHTQNHRNSSGWKLNYDGLSIEDEAKKDILWQEFFLTHQYIDSLIQKKMVLDTTELHLNIGSIDKYVKYIAYFCLNS